MIYEKYSSGVGWAVLMYFANYIQVLVGTAHSTCRSKIKYESYIFTNIVT